MQGSFLTHQNKTHCMTFWPSGEIFLSKAYFAINVISSVVGVLANFLLLLGLRKSKLTKQNTMKVIFSLGCSDFGVSALVMPSYLAALYYQKANCTLHLISMFVFFAFAVNTANMLLILSIDRVLQISWPLFYRAWITRKHVKLVLICAWVFAPVSAICVFFANPLTQICILLTIGMTFYTISVTSYARILFVVRTHRKKIRTGSSSISRNENVNGSERLNGENRKSETQKRNNKKITFKLQVEVFDDSAVIDENPVDNAGKTSYTAKSCVSQASKRQGAREYHQNPHRNGNPEILLAVPEQPKERNEPMPAFAISESADPNQEEPGKVTEEKEGDKKVVQEGPNGSTCGPQRDHNGTDRNTESAKKISISRRPSRLQAVNFHDREAPSSTSLRKEFKVTWTVAIVIITLFVCYVPYIWSAFLWVLKEYEDETHSSYRLRSAYAWTLSIAYLHSSVNPVIMLARNKKLRSAVKDMFIRLIS